MFANTRGSGNTACGSYALWNNTTGYSNVAVGGSTGPLSIIGVLNGNTTGYNNTSVGFESMYSNSIGNDNIGIGYLSCVSNVSGNYNTAVGDSSGPTTGSLTNTITLGYGAKATASNEVVIGNANVSSLYCMGAYAATTANSANMVVASNGQIMRSTSSARYKTNIHDLDINTDRLYDLRPVSYTSKIDGKEYFGLVAEDVAKVLPDLAEYARAKDVIPGSTSNQLIPDAVKYPMLSVLLLDELKKEHTKSESQEKELESQKQDLASQTKIIADLERRVESLEASQKIAR